MLFLFVVAVNAKVFETSSKTGENIGEFMKGIIYYDAIYT